MIGKFRKVMIALVMSATLAGVAASPAQAQRYDRDRDRGRVSTGTAIGIGLLGLGLGIAASQGSSRGYSYRDYDYYAPPRYAPPRRYYRDCWQERVWDRYYRAWVVRRFCR